MTSFLELFSYIKGILGGGDTKASAPKMEIKITC